MSSDAVFCLNVFSLRVESAMKLRSLLKDENVGECAMGVKKFFYSGHDPCFKGM